MQCLLLLLLRNKLTCRWHGYILHHLPVRHDHLRRMLSLPLWLRLPDWHPQRLLLLRLLSVGSRHHHHHRHHHRHLGLPLLLLLLLRKRLILKLSLRPHPVHRLHRHRTALQGRLLLWLQMLLLRDLLELLRLLLRMNRLLGTISALVAYRQHHRR